MPKSAAHFYAGVFDSVDIAYYVGETLKTATVAWGSQAPDDLDPATLSADWVDTKPSARAVAAHVPPAEPVDAPIAPPVSG